MNKIHKETHVEISDGDTLILSVSNCPLTEPISDKLIVNNTICCINGIEKCPNFYKYINGENGVFIQCSKIDIKSPHVWDNDATSKVTENTIPEFTKVIKNNIDFNVKIPELEYYEEGYEYYIPRAVYIYIAILVIFTLIYHNTDFIKG